MQKIKIILLLLFICLMGTYLFFSIPRLGLGNTKVTSIKSSQIIDNRIRISGPYNASNKGYKIKDGKVYWSDAYYLYPINDVDVKTFETIDETFSKDKNQVYFTTIYAGTRIIENADPSSFKIISEDNPIYNTYYTKDKNHVFYNSRLIADADPDSFQRINDAVNKDKKNVWFITSKLPNADPASFQVMNDYFEKDENQVYLQEKLVADADPTNFQILNINYTKDKNHVFYWGAQMPNVDATSFQVVPGEGVYAKDKKTVFYKDGMIVGADPQTFEVLPNYPFATFAKDKNRVFYEASIYPVNDPATFMIVNCSTAKDKTRTYDIPPACAQPIKIK